MYPIKNLPIILNKYKEKDQKALGLTCSYYTNQTQKPMISNSTITREPIV